MLATPRLLDVQSLPVDDRSSAIRHAVEGLDVGDAIIIVGDPDLKPELAEIQAAQSTGFEWHVLEVGDERLRVEVRRQTDAPARTITDYLEHDHDRIDTILADVEQLVAAGTPAHARATFAEFCCGLDRHIAVEEAILFPHFEQATGMTHGPTVVMRAEHVEIRRWMAAAQTALAAGEMAAFAEAIERLKAVLGPHNFKEESILYPMADRATATPEDRDALVRQMQALD